ncbi:MAG: tRNA lysidine(34) synthetase TilS [Legionellaceae bacterium]|nr:tRNA lysidine(34) synthetase TilS [Legionellaceae bacterium]
MISLWRSGLVINLKHLTRFAGHTRLWIGLSGGLDSMVLLHALSCEPALASKLHAVHVHHGLSPQADAWQAHCEEACAALNIPLEIQHVQLDKNQSNLEEAARDARFKIFDACIQSNACLVLAHHQDDQAETLLLRLLRGSGVDGLGAMQVYRPFGRGYLARPLLDTRKHQLLAYAKQHALVWVDDESNQELRFSRNYLRHEVMPRLQETWPRAIESMSACASRCQEAQANLDDLAYLDCPDLALKQPKLSLTDLRDLPIRRLKQVLRVWFKNQDIKALSAVQLEVLIQDVVFTKPDAMPLMRLGKLAIRRYRDVLYVMRDGEQPKACDYLSALSALPVALRIPEGAQVEVRFRVGGERLKLNGQTKSLKALFQAWGVPPWERDRIPLIFIDNTLAAVLDFAIGDDYHQVTCDA